METLYLKRKVFPINIKMHEIRSNSSPRVMPGTKDKYWSKRKDKRNERQENNSNNENVFFVLWLARTEVAIINSFEAILF